MLATAPIVVDAAAVVAGMISAAERPVVIASYLTAPGAEQIAANAVIVAPHYCHSFHLHSTCHSPADSMLFFLQRENNRHVR